MEAHGDERWLPQTPDEQEMVLRELEVILASPPFRNSKRYPALLGYVVTQTLAGNAARLKERTLGVEVFHRPPDYDTNADPVVRLTAGEVRKKIAQYYQEAGNESRLRINIPLGAYAAEFRMRSAASEASQDAISPVTSITISETAVPIESGVLPDQESASPLRKISSVVALRDSVAWPLRVGVTLVVLVIATVYTLYGLSAHITGETIWAPLLKPQGAVLIVAGNGPRQTPTPLEAGQSDTNDHTHGPYNHISVCEAIALSRLAQVMGQYSKTYEIKEADLTRLEDLRSHPAILVGAYNNMWSMRLVEPLRFHFARNNNVVQIIDRQNPGNNDWSVDYTNSYSSAQVDYAVVARYHDQTTNGPLLIIAGIGAYGTQAATELLTTPLYLDRIRAYTGRNRPESNIELVIKTSIVNGSAGPPQIVSSTTW